MSTTMSGIVSHPAGLLVGHPVDYLAGHLVNLLGSKLHWRQNQGVTEEKERW